MDEIDDWLKQTGLFYFHKAVRVKMGSTAWVFVLNCELFRKW